jgi:hypothetical protein
MTDTPQSLGTGETVASDPIADAAQAFKNAVPELVTDKPRDERGRFASTQEEQEIEAEDEEAVGAAEADAESHEDEEITEEAAEEAQPEAVDLPPSWPAEHAETWNALPPETQALIVEREGQREAAVNAKFQEAANLRKANEAVINEANTNRQRFAEAADFVLSLVEPSPPPTSMLTPGSHDYNPDAYHLQMARYHEQRELVGSVKQQREAALAQLQAEAQAAEMQVIEEIEARTRPALLKDVPDLSDPQKQPVVLTSLIQYAVTQGIPEDVFRDPDIARGVTSAQLHILWKAQQYDKQSVAKAKVQPKAVRQAAPPVRPGVATSASAAKHAERKKINDRLAREGSVEAGAAFFKTLKF